MIIFERKDARKKNLPRLSHKQAKEKKSNLSEVIDIYSINWMFHTPHLSALAQFYQRSIHSKKSDEMDPPWLLTAIGAFLGVQDNFEQLKACVGTDPYGNTIWHYVAASGNVSLIKQAMEQGLILSDTKNQFGATIGHFIARSGNLPAVICGIQQGIIDPNARDYLNSSLGHYFALSGNQAGLELGIDSGVFSQNHANYHENSYIDFLERGCAMPVCRTQDTSRSFNSTTQNPTAMNMAFAGNIHGLVASVQHKQYKKFPCSVGFALAKSGYYEGVKQAIELGIINQYERSTTGGSLWHYFARSGNYNGLQQAINDGLVNIHYRTQDNLTLGHFMAWSGNIRGVLHGIEAGLFDPHAKARNGATLGHYLARSGNVDAIDLWCKQKNVDQYEKDNNGETYGHMIAHSGKIEAFKQAAFRGLIALECKNALGVPPAFYFSLSGSFDIIEQAVDDKLINPMLSDVHGNSYAFYVAKRGNLEHVLMALNRGWVTPTQCNKKGESIWDIYIDAIKNTHPEALRQLEYIRNWQTLTGAKLEKALLDLKKSPAFALLLLAIGFKDAKSVKLSMRHEYIVSQLINSIGEQPERSRHLALLVLAQYSEFSMPILHDCTYECIIGLINYAPLKHPLFCFELCLLAQQKSSNDIETYVALAPVLAPLFQQRYNQADCSITGEWDAWYINMLVDKGASETIEYIKTHCNKKNSTATWQFEQASTLVLTTGLEGCNDAVPINRQIQHR